MEPRKEEIKEVPTLEGMLDQNRKLINECLEITRTIYTEFTSDAVPESNTNEPTCIMGDIMGQNQNLKILLDLIISVKNQIR